MVGQVAGTPKLYKVVSLFTGGMGLDLGLEQTKRFEILACVEKVPVFCDTIRKNRDAGRTGNQHLKVFQGDITTFDPLAVLSELGLKPGELDLLVGGPPCQSFSTTGKRGTVQDPRGTMLWQFLRFIGEMKPKMFLMENVRGLISAGVRHRPISQRPEKGGLPLEDDERAGAVVRRFIDDLDEQYRVDCFEVNAVNYGAPQLRERALFVGNRFGDRVEFPPPTHGSGVEAPGLFDNPSRGFQPYRTLGDAISGLRDVIPTVMDFSPRKKRYLSLVPPGGNWRSLPEPLARESMGKAFFAKGGRSGWWRRLSFDLPCPTLVTMPNHASTALCHPTEVRALTLREYARIQEFPDDWEFCGTPSEQYAQVGNAVPVRLGRVAGDMIADHLDSIAEGRPRPRRAGFDRFRLVYVQSHVRTRQWYKDGEAVVWNDGGDNGTAKYAAPKTHYKERQLKE